MFTRLLLFVLIVVLVWALIDCLLLTLILLLSGVCFLICLFANSVGFICMFFCILQVVLLI